MNGPVPHARVTVLIPTYRDAHLLRKSLPVFLQNPPRELEVVILNNDPSQDIRASVGDDADDPRVKIVEMGESYFSRAANRGIRESSGGLVMFCNADLFPTPTYLDEIMGFFDAHPRAGAAIGKVLRYDLASDEPTDVIDTAGLPLDAPAANHDSRRGRARHRPVRRGPRSVRDRRGGDGRSAEGPGADSNR